MFNIYFINYNKKCGYMLHNVSLNYKKKIKDDLITINLILID